MLLSVNLISFFTILIIYKPTYKEYSKQEQEHVSVRIHIVRILIYKFVFYLNVKKLFRTY